MSTKRLNTEWDKYRHENKAKWKANHSSIEVEKRKWLLQFHRDWCSMSSFDFAVSTKATMELHGYWKEYHDYCEKHCCYLDLRTAHLLSQM